MCYNELGRFANRVVRDIASVPHLLARLPTFRAGISATFIRDPESKTAGRSECFQKESTHE
jgi:hypothetical protein